MRYHLIPVPFAIAGICIYWYARQGNDLSTVAVIQPAITFLCIITALLSLRGKNPNRRLTVWICTGLALALLGDFLSLDMTDPFVVILGRSHRKAQPGPLIWAI